MNVRTMVDRWLSLDQNPQTRKVIEDLVKAGNDTELLNCLSEPLTFGTAGRMSFYHLKCDDEIGLRAPMGAGFARMNQLTVIQATQGVCMYLLSPQSTCDVLQQGVVIGYDHRHHSQEFALLAASVFLDKRVPVHLYPSIVPTPFIPFAVKYFGAACGIMITASHNPKEDNGYKLYGQNACQIISPHDKHIQKLILEHQVPWIWSTDCRAKVRIIGQEVIDAYFNRLVKLCTHIIPKCDLKWVYTGMHGVGYPFAKRAIDTFGLPAIIPVPEQVEPDPDFPTVVYPNPEEGAGALALAMQVAERQGATIIFANDPDADRLAIAERQRGGTWWVLNGNEIGTVLGYEMWRRTVQHVPNDKTSTVSSKMLKRIGEIEGFHFEESLTGFKWLGNIALDKRKQGFTVPFAYEEAIGFMVGESVPDKDGISALAVLAELSLKLYNEGSTLRDCLNGMYSKYGYFCSQNSYFICRSPPTIAKIFNEMRYRKGDDQDKSSQIPTLAYPETIGPFQVKNVRDLTVGYDSKYEDMKARLPTSKSSQMITFDVAWAEKGVQATLTLRTSGTEPKIKYYSEMSGPFDKKDEIETYLGLLVKQMTQELLKPECHGLQSKLK